MKMRWHKRLSRQLRGALRKKVLARYGVAVLADSRNGLLAVAPNDYGVSRALLRDGEYDTAAINVLSALVSRSAEPRMIFVGTHIGALLVPIARAARTRQILAYEPSPQNRRLLELNLLLNGLDGVDVRSEAVGERRGMVRFKQNPLNSGNSRVARHDGELEVPMVTLDDSVPQQWEPIDLMVMDIEGAEVHAIRGGRNTLARTRYLFVEYAPEQLEEQSTRKEEFIDLVSERFHGMCLLGPPARFFQRHEFRTFLQTLPRRRGLLLNLLFCQESALPPVLSRAAVSKRS